MILPTLKLILPTLKLVKSTLKLILPTLKLAKRKNPTKWHQEASVDDSTTAVMCAVGVPEGFEVKMGLHQGSTLSPCLLAMVMDRMTDEIREEAPWTMMLADVSVICSESKEQVEEKLESWRYALDGS